MNEETSTDTVSAEAVRRSLDGCLRAPAFRRSQKLAAFLNYIVEEELAGRGEAIKAYSIATQALGRADSFDASNDPSVRVEAGRLRRVLDEVYAEEGRRWPIRILVPVGAYRPSFEPQAEEDPQPAEALRPASAPALAPVPTVAAVTATPLLRSLSSRALALFETRGQAVLALLLAVIALLLAVEVALQIYVLVHS